MNGRLPTMRQLDRLGSDAFKVLEAHKNELENAAAMAADVRSRRLFKADMRRLNKRWDEAWQDAFPARSDDA